MALSEQEQKRLQQLESALSSEDPRFADTFTHEHKRQLHKPSLTLAGLGFLAGIALLIGGMRIHPAVAVLGFVVMLISALVALKVWKTPAQSNSTKPDSSLPPTVTARVSDQGQTNFMDKLEERWKRRQSGE